MDVGIFRHKKCSEMQSEFLRIEDVRRSFRKVISDVLDLIGGHDHRIVRFRVASSNIPFQQRGDIVLNYVLYILLTHNTEDANLVFAVAGSGELRRHMEKIQGSLGRIV